MMKRQWHYTSTVAHLIRTTLVVVSVALIVLGAHHGAQAQVDPSNEIREDDPIRTALCLFGDDSIPGRLYQNSQSSDDEFYFRSKTFSSAPLGLVDSPNNELLSFGTGYTHRDVNTPILGFNEKTPIAQGNTRPQEGAQAPNQGPRVNPFDRFGMEGATFSAYFGEWRHILIEACNPKSTPVDPRWNEFYEGRLIPLSTWEDINESIDPRTLQFNRSILNHLDIAFYNNLANDIFTFNKAIVSVTIAFINIAFSDVVSSTGFIDVFTNTAKTGIMDRLTDTLTIFLVSMGILGLLFIYLRFVRKGKENTKVLLMRFLGVLFTFIVIAKVPQVYFGTPMLVLNTIQSGLSQALLQDFTEHEGFCTTNVNTAYNRKPEAEPVQDGLENPPATPQSISDIINASEFNNLVRSGVACKYYEYEVFRPFNQIQFGTSWNNLWVQDPPAWAGENAKKITYPNAPWTGDFRVMLGNNETLSHLGLFQISTQTDIHTPLETLDQNPVSHSGFNSSAANDRYRIIDALSGYNEHIETLKVGNETTNVVVPSQPHISPYWDFWVGNHPKQRVFQALSTIPISLTVVGTSGAFALISSALSVAFLVWLVILLFVLVLAIMVAEWATTILKYYLYFGAGIFTLALAFKILFVVQLAITLPMLAKVDGSILGYWAAIIVIGLMNLVFLVYGHRIVQWVQRRIVDYIPRAKLIEPSIEQKLAMRERRDVLVHGSKYEAYRHSAEIASSKGYHGAAQLLNQRAERHFRQAPPSSGIQQARMKREERYKQQFLSGKLATSIDFDPLRSTECFLCKDELDSLRLFDKLANGAVLNRNTEFWAVQLDSQPDPVNLCLHCYNEATKPVNNTPITIVAAVKDRFYDAKMVYKPGQPDPTVPAEVIAHRNNRKVPKTPTKKLKDNLQELRYTPKKKRN